jgi:hypothetical protein
MVAMVVLRFLSKTAAQVFQSGPVFYPILFQHDRKPVWIRGSARIKPLGYSANPFAESQSVPQTAAFIQPYVAVRARSFKVAGRVSDRAETRSGEPSVRN